MASHFDPAGIDWMQAHGSNQFHHVGFTRATSRYEDIMRDIGLPEYSMRIGATIGLPRTLVNS